MATQAEVIRRNIQDNAARDSRQQLGDFGSSQTEEIARGIPVLNDAALAASIEQWKATDIQYQRAQNDEAREQIEAAYMAGQQRLNRAKQEIRDRAELETVQRNQSDSASGDRLALQMQSLVSTFQPNWTPETLSMDQLRQLSDLRQQVQDLAAATGAEGLAPGVLESGGPLAPTNVLGLNQPRHKVTEQDAAKWITNHGDGTYTVKLETGEIFKGTPEEVMAKQAAGQVNTKYWAREGWQQAKAQQPAQQPTAETTQLNQQPQQQIISPTQQSSLADYWAAEQADAMARQFGLPNKDALRQWGENVSNAVETINHQQVALEFMARCPDFPETEQANQALLEIAASNGWQITPSNLQAAHLLAVQNHLYQPLTPEQIQIANGAEPQQHRNAPPPMLRTNNPEISNQQLSPYDMPMGDLRKAAIRQELERQGPNYR